MIAFQNPEIFILLLVIGLILPKALKFDSYRKLIGLTNILAAVLLILTAAGPQMTVDDQKEPRPNVKVLQDASESSQLIKQRTFNSENADITVETVNSDRNNFNEQVKSVTDANETILIDSDLNTNVEGLENYFEQKNISANLYRGKMREEHAVKIEGPSSTVIGAENSFKAVSSSTENITDIEVGIGNETIYSGDAPHEFDLSFEKEGHKRLWINSSEPDEYVENNNYFKTVEIMEKPKVASVGGEEGLEEDLEDFYDVDRFNSAPQDLDKYDAVLLKESIDSPELRDYLVEGGGLVYTGDSYDQSYLPVRGSEESVDTSAPLVVLGIDISTGTAESGAAREGKRIAYELVDQLPGNTRVGVVAYNRYAYDIVDPVRLDRSRDHVKDKISSLQPEGPTFHNRGLRASDSMLRNSEYSQGNILMIADGKISTLGERNDVRRETVLEAERSNARVITVGVGDEYPQEIGEEEKEFLTEVAERTRGGYYIDGHSTDELEFNFDAGGGTEEDRPLKVTDSNHFITEGGVRASVSSIDSTEAKSQASQILSVADGRPFLTTWRFGLGKVSAFSGSGQDLEGLMEDDPGVVGRTFSWVTASDEDELWVEGNRVGDEFNLVSRDDREGFTRVSDNRFEKDLNPDSTGFYQSEGLIYSVNYRPEIEEIGYNEENIKRVTVDGRVYSRSEIQDFFSSLESESTDEWKTVELTPYVLAFFLVFYLVFVGLRKRKGLA